MALTVVSRPAKEIDGSTSTWNALNLPIQYKLDSDLFPLNSAEASFASASFANNNGYLEVTVVGGTANILTGEYVKLSGSDVDSFDGNWKVKETISNTVYVLNVNYDATLTTTTLQKYYNNYFTEVKVFAGLPTWHVDYASNPIIEVGVLRVIPNVSNQIIASFSGIIKSEVSTYNQLSEGIELSAFTGFYIQWREGYDENVLGEIETAYTSWQLDEVVGCGVDAITNGDFVTDLTGWTQVDADIVGEPFVWSAGVASSNLNTIRETKVIYQEVNMIANLGYTLTVDITRSSARSSKFAVYGTNDLINFTVLYFNDSTVNVSVNEVIVPSSSYQYIGFHFYRAQTPVSTTVTLDNISFTPSVCEYLFWGSNSSLQFQNSRGGNMYDYVAKDVDSKFMTNFDNPTIFTGEYFDTSIILDSPSVSDFDISDIADMWLVAGDVALTNGDPVPTWVDRTGNVTVTSILTKEPTYKEVGINGFPSMLFNGVDQSFQTDINLAQPLIVYTVFKANVKSNIWDSDEPSRMALFTTSIDGKFAIWNGSTALLDPDVYALGTDVVVKAVIDGSNSCLFIDNVLVDEGDLGAVPMLNTNIGKFGSSYLNGEVSEMIILPAGSDPCRLWQVENYIGNKYGTYTSSDYGYIKNEYDVSNTLLSTEQESITYTDTGVYRISPTVTSLSATKIDIQLLSGDSCVLSELKEFNVNNECSNQEIYLTWLNELGGWEYWKFTSEKNYNLNIESKDTIKRNVFADWDTDFITGDTELDVINSSAYKEVDVFSQYLTLDQVEAISVIKYAIKVQVVDGDNKVTVVVDSSSITVHKDSDDDTLHTIRFKIRYPNIQIQSQ